MPSGPKRPPARREHTGSAQADRMQGVANDLAGLVRRCPFCVGRLVSVTLTGAVTKVVWHRLGVPASYFVVRQPTSAASYIAEVPADTPDEDNSVAVVTDVTGTFDLWFYPRASRPIDSETGQSR